MLGMKDVPVDTFNTIGNIEKRQWEYDGKCRIHTYPYLSIDLKTKKRSQKENTPSCLVSRRVKKRDTLKVFNYLFLHVDWA